MSLEKEQIQVIISANADQFRKELADVYTKLGTLEKKTSKTGGVLGNNFTGSMIKANIASQILIGTVKRVGSAIFNVGSKVMNLGTQYTRLKVATDTVTRNMGMSREEVDKLRVSLEDANTYGSQAENVIKTLALSGLVDMADGLKTVDARTGEASTGVEALVLTMKDLGAAAGIDSAQAIEKLTKFIRRGEIAFADGVIEIGNINQAYNEYALKAGKTLQTLSQEERARVRLNIVMEEGEKAFGAYANTMQTAGKAMDSTKNAMTSIFERLGGYLEPLFASVARAVFQFVNAIRESLIQNADAFRNWAMKIAAYVVVVVRVLGMLLSKIPVIGKNFQALKDFALKPVVNAVDSLTSSVDSTSNAMKGATKSTKELKKELLGLAGFDEMNVLKQPNEDGGGGTGGVSGVGIGGMNVKDLFNADELNKATSSVNLMADEIEKTLLPKLRELYDELKKIWESPLVIWLRDNWKEILKWIGILGGVIAVINTVIKVVAWVSTAVTTLSGIFSAIAGVIGTVATAIGVLIATGSIVPVLIVALVALLIWAAVIIVKRWDEIEAKFLKWFGILKDNLNMMGENIKAFFSNVGKSIDTFVIKVGNQLIIMKEGFKIIGNDIKKWFVGVGTSIKNSIGSAIDWIVDRFNRVKLSFVDFGGKVIIAIKQPINSMIDKINRLLDSVRGIRIPVMFPNGINIPRIPRLATGGVIQSPTIAMLGEAGKEVVMPLENNTGWIDELARKIGNREGNMNLIVKIGEDKIYEKTIDYINDKALRSGATILNI